MIMMNMINRKNSRFSGTRIYLYATQLRIAVHVMTNTTATPRPKAVLTSRETDVNGHMPRKYIRRMLFVKMAAKHVTAAVHSCALMLIGPSPGAA
jgi:hypothetical protein